MAETKIKRPSFLERMSRAQLLIALSEQEAWIEKCGGTLEGYIERYGSKKDADHYGDGGEAIYKADTDHLKKIKALLKKNPRRGGITLALVLRHISHRQQLLSWETDRGGDYRDCSARKEELEALEKWIEERQ